MYYAYNVCYYLGGWWTIGVEKSSLSEAIEYAKRAIGPGVPVKYRLVSRWYPTQ